MDHKKLTMVKQKGFLLLLTMCGCATVKPRPCRDYTLVMAKKDVEIKQLKEEELFEEAMVEDVSRELAILREKVHGFVNYPHTCKHLGMLK